MSHEYILELKDIAKVYDNGVVANKNISVGFRKGEIHAIVGENGAGKSTLMKIIFGLQKPTSGQILFNGKEISFQSPLDSIGIGIGMVHQHFMLVPSFTVLQNIVLGDEPTRFSFIDSRKSKKKAEDLAKQYNFQLSMDEKIENLSVGMKQKVEILKLLYKGAKVLILDEPTAVLTPQETEQLFVELKKFKESGHTIIFISHKLNEVKEISDRISVIRKGELISTHNTEDVSLESISELMIGRRVEYEYSHIKKEVANKKITLKMDQVTLQDGKINVLDNINLIAKSGEILGVVGVEGNGQSELVEVLFGYKQPTSGTIAVNGISLLGKKVKDIRDNAKVAYIPEDRMRQGIAGSASIKENMISSFFDAKEFNHKFWMNHKAIDELSDSLIKEYSVVCQSKETEIESLSGGNIQKVVVARECYANPELLIAEQPTRGVDVGSASFIHEKLIELRNSNKAIVLLSADLGEALAVSDKLIVMYEGQIVGFFNDLSELTETELGLYMLGIKKQKKEDIERVMYEKA
ncbi:ABC transporter ATP-binding protein [Clostridium sp. Marseille-P299]|uniref:ABC transporter ATP-binding protein n=1 Tax=Clostridium sp. Marseille-P299 TaxID=1805477 RepID=UPI000834AA8E|nr:ABC transporter ATP-binding protein [Clostridium sp. Marseille-P299]